MRRVERTALDYAPTMPAVPPTASIQRFFRIPASVAVAWVLFAVTACASPPAPKAPSFRILIEFRAPTDGAATELLAHLEQQSGAVVRYAASISPKRHAYELVCPADDAGCETATHLLREDVRVREVIPDALRKPHTPPP